MERLERYQPGNLSLKTIEDAEGWMLAQPQAEAPVIHHFGPGIYMREVFLPAGTFAIGHYQKFEQMNVFLKGKVSMLVNENETKIIEAPMIYIGKPGRKVGFILEDTVWLNIYSTDETDIEKLEDMLLIKSDTWEKFHVEQKEGNII